MDFEGQFIFGNIFEQSFKKIFFGRKIHKIRKMISKNKLGFCKECDLVNQKTFGEKISYRDL
tara:strand:- start:5157 stop:5342 length:186 start_codon:yes stop_codon:yes gene_type:complete